MTSAYVTKLGLRPRSINFNAQKIDSLVLEINGIILASFLLQDSQKRVRFFEKTFLLANTSLEVVLKIFFLDSNNADIKFVEQEKLIKRL